MVLIGCFRSKLSNWTCLIANIFNPQYCTTISSLIVCVPKKKKLHGCLEIINFCSCFEKYFTCSLCSGMNYLLGLELRDLFSNNLLLFVCLVVCLTWTSETLVHLMMSLVRKVTDFKQMLPRCLKCFQLVTIKPWDTTWECFVMILTAKQQ